MLHELPRCPQRRERFRSAETPLPLVGRIALATSASIRWGAWRRIPARRERSFAASSPLPPTASTRAEASSSQSVTAVGC